MEADVLLLFFYVLLLLHAPVAGLAVYDLLTYSRRNNKLLWFLFILSAPVLGAHMYSKTMKRRKKLQHAGIRFFL